MSSRFVLFKTRDELPIRPQYIVCFRHSAWNFFLLKTKQKWIDELSWRESIHLEVHAFYSLSFKFSVSNVTIEIVNQTEQHKHIRREESQNKSDDFTILLNENVSYSFWNKTNWKTAKYFIFSLSHLSLDSIELIL